MAARSVWAHVPADTAQHARGIEVASVDEALRKATKLISSVAAASKARVDLASFSHHAGQQFATQDSIPDALFSEQLQVLPCVELAILLSPGAGKGTSAGTDAVVLLYDAAGGRKGLPANKRGSMLATAAGQAIDLRGECVVGRLSSATTIIELGAEAVPQFLVERDWLEAAQAEQKRIQLSLSDGVAGEHGAVATQLKEILREKMKKCVVRLESEIMTASGTLDMAAGPDTTEQHREAPSVKFEDAGKEVIVTVSVPAETKARHVRCLIGDQKLTRYVDTMLSAHTCVADDMLFQPVIADDCTWSLEGEGGSRTLRVTLMKQVHMRWLMLFRSV